MTTFVSLTAHETLWKHATRQAHPMHRLGDMDMRGFSQVLSLIAPQNVSCHEISGNSRVYGAHCCEPLLWQISIGCAANLSACMQRVSVCIYMFDFKYVYMLITRAHACIFHDEYTCVYLCCGARARFRHVESCARTCGKCVHTLTIMRTTTAIFACVHVTLAYKYRTHLVCTGIHD
jgi:hypothetical protein